MCGIDFETKSDIKLETSLYKRIESPLSAFNNVINQLTEKLQAIYTDGESCKNFSYLKKYANQNFLSQLLFENKSITVFGCIKIMLVEEDIVFKFNGNFSSPKLDMIQKTIEHKYELKQIMQQYLYIVDSVSNNYDASISHRYIESIYDSLMNESSKNKNINQMFLVPYKNKIKHLYDCDDKCLEKLFNRYTYVIKFSRKSNSSFNYKLNRVLSSELDESKSIENIRFEDVETLREDTLPIEKLNNFLVNLYYYGELTY